MENEESLDSEISDSFEEEAFGSDDDDDDALLQSLSGKDSVLEAAKQASGHHSLSDPFAAQETFKFLDEFLDGHQHDMDEEEEDPDIKNDPIHNINLREYIESFIVSLAKDSSPNSFAILLGHLPPLEKKHFDNYLSKLL